MTELDFSTPPRLNSFGETIRRIEAERLAEAQAAITAYYNTLPTAAQRAYDEIYESEEK